jgi:hypothetical protein
MDNDDSFVQGDELVEGIYDQSDNLILFSDTGIITNHNLTQHLMEEYPSEDDDDDDERETPETVCYQEAEPQPDIPAEPRDVFNDVVIEDLEQGGRQEGHEEEQEGVEEEEDDEAGAHPMEEFANGVSEFLNTIVDTLENFDDDNLMVDEPDFEPSTIQEGEDDRRSGDLVTRISARVTLPTISRGLTITAPESPSHTEGGNTRNLQNFFTRLLQQTISSPNDSLLENVFNRSLRDVGGVKHVAKQEVIDSLPIADISAITEINGEDVECAICLMKVVDTDSTIQETSMLPCRHPFHRDCIKEWLKDNSKCPVCRFELPFNEISLVTNQVIEEHPSIQPLTQAQVQEQQNDLSGIFTEHSRMAELFSRVFSQPAPSVTRNPFGTVPEHMFFNRSPGLALPLSSLNYQTSNSLLGHGRGAPLPLSPFGIPPHVSPPQQEQPQPQQSNGLSTLQNYHPPISVDFSSISESELEPATVHSSGGQPTQQQATPPSSTRRTLFMPLPFTFTPEERSILNNSMGVNEHFLSSFFSSGGNIFGMHQEDSDTDSEEPEQSQEPAEEPVEEPVEESVEEPAPAPEPVEEPNVSNHPPQIQRRMFVFNFQPRGNTQNEDAELQEAILRSLRET